MNSTEKTIVDCLHQAMRGEPIENTSLTLALSDALTRSNLHSLACEMVKALIEHHQSDLRTQRALLLVQAGRSDHA